MYNQTFPSAIRLWNTLPVDVCQLPPDSFKAQLNTYHHPADVTADGHVFTCTTVLFLFFAVWLPVETGQDRQTDNGLIA